MASDTLKREGLTRAPETTAEIDVGRPIQTGVFPVWQGTMAEIEREPGGSQWLVYVADLRRLLRGDPPFRTKPQATPCPRLTEAVAAHGLERPWVKATDPIAETWVGREIELTAAHTAPWPGVLRSVGFVELLVDYNDHGDVVIQRIPREHTDVRLIGDAP